MKKRPSEWTTDWKPFFLRFLGDYGKADSPENDFMTGCSAATSILCLILGFWLDNYTAFVFAWLCMAYAYQTIPRKGE